KLASSFGGGMGRLREVCGAVSGMFMISGLAQGFAEKKSPEKAEHYQRIQDLAAAFKKENGSIICRELLGLDKGNQTTVSGDAFAATPEERTAEYYKKRPCPEICKQAADIIEQFLEK
ncbi:MAG: C_GCAxxG_C_C family protein, partial [Treponema sp.]|nr:C_GCAxxG_C_C family protein [Treponema sp.]